MMAKVYYVKDGSSPQHLVDPFGRRIALAELEGRLRGRDARSTQQFFREVVDEVASIKGRVSGAILFTMVKTGTVFNVAGQEEMKTLGYPVLETALGHRITYQEAFAQGMSVEEYDHRSKATDEMQAVFRELQEGL
jgi:cellulose biosynthesis protein BcsQ